MAKYSGIGFGDSAMPKAPTSNPGTSVQPKAPAPTQVNPPPTPTPPSKDS
jgi:hypothetical protein